MFPYFQSKVKHLSNIIMMIIIMIIIRKITIKKINKKKRYILFSFINLFHVEGHYHYYLPSCFE